VAYNNTDDEFMVVWQGSELAVGPNEIFAQRVDATDGSLVGSRTMVSPTDHMYAHAPAMAYNDQTNQYLVVWEGENVDETEPVDPPQAGIPLPMSVCAPHTGVAYNPNRNLYYAVRAGNSSFELNTYDANGALLNTTPAGFDFRGLWWNPNTATLEGNGYNTNGYRVVDLDANGYALSTGTNLAGLFQPDAQSVGDYDFQANEVIFYDNGRIYRYARTTGAALGNYAITGLPVATGNLNSNTVGYTGIAGKEILVYDYVTKRVYFIDKATGAFVQQVQLPASAPGPSIYDLSYANAKAWISDCSQWISYDIINNPLAQSNTNIFGQLLNASGSLSGTVLSITDDGFGIFNANPDVAYNSTSNKYMVVWSGDDGGGPSAKQVFGHLLGSGGALDGSQFQVSFMGEHAFAPSMAYNATSNEYMVVWQGSGSGSLAPGEDEIFGRKLLDSGPAGSTSRISTMGTDGNASFEGKNPDVAFNSQDGQYLVAWHGDATADGENEIYGQLVSPGGSLTGAAFQISLMGPGTDPAYDAFYPQLAYNGLDNEFLVAWQADDDGSITTDQFNPDGTITPVQVNTGLIDDEWEIWAQRVYVDGTPAGANRNRAIRISDMGNSDGLVNFIGLTPHLSFDPTRNNYLLAWIGQDNATGAGGDNDDEIYGQLWSPNFMPTGITLAPQEIDENLVAPVGTLGVVDISDPNLDNYTYTLVSGALDNDLFTITSAGSVFSVETTGPIDFESKPTAQIRVTVDDSRGGSFTQDLTITINDINEVPSFTLGPDQNLLYNLGPQAVPGWATNISDGDDGSQVLSFEVTNNTNPGLFDAGGAPAVSAAGDLSFTSALDQVGEAQITIQLRDDGPSGPSASGMSTHVDVSNPQIFTITIETDCPTPANPIASNPGDNSIELAWQSVIGGLSYEVRYKVVGATSWTSTSTANTNIILSGLASAASYVWKVKAICNEDGSFSSAFTSQDNFATTGAPSCPAPVNLSSANDTDNSQNLDWDLVTEADHYEVQYRVQGTAVWNTVLASSNELTPLSGLSAGTGYEWKVRSVCDPGGTLISPFSGLSSFTTSGPAACATPTGTSESGIGDNAATLNWGVVAEADHYDVQYRVQGTSPWTTSSPGTNSLALSGLETGTTYQWKVRSVCAADNSIASTYSSLDGFSTTGAPSCAAPTGTSESGIGDNAATLNWGTVTGALDYQIKYRVNGTSSWTTTNTGDASISIGLTGLSSATNYQWKVKAICAADGSIASTFSALDAFSTTGATACPAPTGLIPSEPSTSTIDLSWSNEPAAVSYQLRYRVLNTPPWTIVSVGTNSTTLTGLNIGTTYQWRLKSVCAADGSIVSINSPTSTFATSASRVGEVDVAETADQDFTIYSHQNSIFINFADSELANSQIQIYDLSGRIYSHIDNSIELRQRLEIPVDLRSSAGIYLVKVVSLKQVTLQRVLLRN